MNEFLLDTALGTVVVIVLLLLAAIAAWGAYRSRPGTAAKKVADTPSSKKPDGPTAPVEKKGPSVSTKPPAAEPAAPKATEEAVEPDTGPCAVERAEIERLKTEVERLKMFGEEAPEVLPKDIPGLIEGLSILNKNLVYQLRAEFKKETPEYDNITDQIGRFAEYCWQRGYKRPEEKQLFEILLET